MIFPLVFHSFQVLFLFSWCFFNAQTAKIWCNLFRISFFCWHRHRKLHSLLITTAMRRPVAADTHVDMFMIIRYQPCDDTTHNKSSMHFFYFKFNIFFLCVRRFILINVNWPRLHLRIMDRPIAPFCILGPSRKMIVQNMCFYTISAMLTLRDNENAPCRWYIQ